MMAVIKKLFLFSFIQAMIVWLDAERIIDGRPNNPNTLKTFTYSHIDWYRPYCS